MDVTGVGAAATENTKADKDGIKLAGDYDTFITLLAAQMKNQDPMDPMKAGEFTQQLVAFSGVEQQIQANKNLESLSAQIAQNSMTAAASYLGKTALIQDDTGQLHDGQITWKYRNDSATSSIKLVVKDMLDNTVSEMDGKTGLGTHDFKWDGKDLGGNPLPDGPYKLVVNAKNAIDEPLEVPIFIKDVITAINTQGYEPSYTVGNASVKAKEILSLEKEN